MELNVKHAKIALITTLMRNFHAVYATLLAKHAKKIMEIAV